MKGKRPTFEEFRATVESSGLQAIDHGRGHWQIKGGRFRVNYYPETRTFYVNGTNAGGKGTFSDAIAATSNSGHKRRSQATRRKKNYTGAKRRLLRLDPHCFWCHRQLTMTTATFEHIIPLSCGGTNGRDNETIACADCNHGRGNKLPTRTKWESNSVKGLNG